MDNSHPSHSSDSSATSATPCSLVPLITEGQAALAPDTIAGITKITLLRIVARWHNAFNEVTERKADDIFACAAEQGTYFDPVPKGAELVEATLGFQVADSPDQHLVHISPPNTLTLQNQNAAQQILALLTRRGFKATQKLALALLLAVCSIDPAFADIADDSDDDSSHPLTRPSLPVTFNLQPSALNLQPTTSLSPFFRN